MPLNTTTREEMPVPSTDVAALQESSLDVLPPAQNPSLVARQMLLAHAEMMNTAYQLAAKMVNTTMVPTRFLRKAEDATAAILYGAELGLNPIQSLQRIIPIHGMPSLEARTMVALLKARGYKIRTSAQSDDSVTVVGVDLEGEVYEATWTIDRARRAGYVPEIDERTGKYKLNANGKLIGNEKYLTDPQAMLKAKAQSEVCRDMAPDVLLGISYTSEELLSENWDSGATMAQQQVQAPKGKGATITADEILADEAPLPEPSAEELRDNIRRAHAVIDRESEERAEAVKRAQDQLDEDTAAEVVADPEAEADGYEEAEAAAEPEPEPVAEAKPEPKKPAKSQTRRALERRLFKLLNESQVEDREDRLIIYRRIIGREDITSTDDLNDVEAAKVGDVLYGWQQKNELDQQITDILNSATLAAESNEN